MTPWKIYKFPLKGLRNQVDLPRGARIIHVDIQPIADGGALLFIWAEVNALEPNETRQIDVRPTGQQPGRVHLGTVVWHVYDNTRIEATS
jgi:hypothetical protein